MHCLWKEQMSMKTIYVVSLERYKFLSFETAFNQPVQKDHTLIKVERFNLPSSSGLYLHVSLYYGIQTFCFILLVWVSESAF